MALVGVLIALNALFVAGEFGLLAVDTTQVDTRAEAGSRRARMVAALRRRLSFHLGAAQLGITVTSLVLGIIAEDTIGDLLGAVPGADVLGVVGLAVAAIVLAAVSQMVLGELAPKNVAVSKPLGTTLVLAPALRLYGWLVAPVVLAFNGAANAVVRALGIRPTEELLIVRTLDELERVLRESSEGELDHDAAELASRTLRLSLKHADDALTPRGAMATVGAKATLDEARRIVTEHGHSTLVVIDEDIDDVVGVVHVADLLVRASSDATLTVADVTATAVVVGEQLALTEVLARLNEAKERLAVVIDEHGGTAGVISREDIVEQVLGELTDERDEPEPASRPRGRLGVVVLSGAASLDEAREALGVDVPDGPYETLAGFILEEAGKLLKAGELVIHEGWQLTASRVDGHAIGEVTATRVPPAETASGDDRPEAASGDGSGVAT